MEERERRRGSRDGNGEEEDEQSGVERDEGETKEREGIVFPFYLFLIHCQLL